MSQTDTPTASELPKADLSVLAPSICSADWCDRLHKVTVTVNAATHVTHPERKGVTLCGRKWWYECDHGTDHYCEPCQRKLAKLLSPNSADQGIARTANDKTA